MERTRSPATGDHFRLEYRDEFLEQVPSHRFGTLMRRLSTTPQGPGEARSPGLRCLSMAFAATHCVHSVLPSMMAPNPQQAPSKAGATTTSTSEGGERCTQRELAQGCSGRKSRAEGFELGQCDASVQALNHGADTSILQRRKLRLRQVRSLPKVTAQFGQSGP